jgi:hypothetical protein
VLWLWATLSPTRASTEQQPTEVKKQRSRKRKRQSKSTELRDMLNVGAALLAAQTTYLLVFHALSNLPLSDPLLFGKPPKRKYAVAFRG